MLVDLRGPIGVTAFVLAACGLAACGRGPASSQPGSDATATAGGVQADAALAGGQLAAALPAPGALPGCTRKTAPHRFGEGDLWEHIDGAADAVQAYGFQELVTASYTFDASGTEVVVDLYRMASDLAAFGLYAQEADPAATLVAIGVEGARQTTLLTFWNGPCYVKLTAFKETPNLAADLEALARHIAGRLGPSGGRPGVLDRFPPEGLIPRSVRVIPKDLLGQSYLPLAFQAQYRTGAKTWALALIPFDGAETAKGAFDRYQEFVSTGGQVQPLRSRATDQAFVGDDSYYGRVVAVLAGDEVAIALGAPTTEAGRIAAVGLLTRSR